MEEKKNNALEKAENATESAKEIERTEVYQDRLTERAEQKVEQEKQEAIKHKRKRMEKEKGGGKRKGLVVAVVALGISTLALASTLTVTYLLPSAADTALEYSYQKSFYDAVEQVDNIDVNLSKVLVSRDSGAIQKYLVDIAINSELAENDIQELPLKDENKYYTTKLINQIGDYSKYLNNKLINGQSLTEKDRGNLEQLYRANLDFKKSLEKMVKEMGNDFSFSTIMEGGAGNLVISNFNELQNLSVEYPELIYDGPFSDGQQGKSPKGLKGGEIDQNKAVEIFNGLFARRGATEVECVGETGGDVSCYNVQGKVKDDLIYAQISKKGGKLIMFDFAGSCRDVLIDEDDAVERGLEFFKTLNIDGMKPVWINLANNVYTINFAYAIDDVIAYSDLIKIRVCAETNTVIGMEAKSYYTNHVERSVEKAALTSEQARTSVFEGLDINSTRLALVPVSNGERLCYEFCGEYKNATYYVYIDAINGRHVETFKVVQNENA